MGLQMLTVRGGKTIRLMSTMLMLTIPAGLAGCGGDQKGQPSSEADTDQAVTAERESQPAE